MSLEDHQAVRERHRVSSMIPRWIDCTNVDGILIGLSAPCGACGEVIFGSVHLMIDQPTSMAPFKLDASKCTIGVRYKLDRVPNVEVGP